MIDNNISKATNFLLQTSKFPLWSKTHNPHLVDQAVCGTFHLATKKNQYKQVTLMLYGQLLYKVKQQKWKVCEIANALLDVVKNPIFGDGIKLTINREIVEFYGKIDDWLEKMKKQCFQQNFTQKYSILKLIGQGTYGKVYCVKNKTNQVQYAVKTFEKSLLISPSDKLSLSKELEIARLFEHPNLLQIVETFESEQFIFVVFEYLQGGNLRQQIKRQKLSEKKALLIIKQVLLGLEHMHSQGIIHRDIKPENIMLRHKDNLDELVIADFGLADQYRKDGKYLFVNCGTPGYCAPELLQSKIYDCKVDIYSVGIMLYQMFVGETPFTSEDYHTRVKLNTQGIIDWSVVQVSGNTLDLLQAMLSRNPFHRLTAQQALIHKCFGQQEHFLNIRNTVSNTLVSTGSQLSSPSPNEKYRQIQFTASPLPSPKINSLSHLDCDELDNLVMEQTQKTKSILQNYPMIQRKGNAGPQFQQKIQHRQVKSEVLLFFQE